MKSKLQLIVKGKPIYVPVNLTEEQIRQIINAADIANKAIGWDAPEVGQIGYYENAMCDTCSFEVTPDQEEFAHRLHNNANYYTSEETARAVIKADLILRKLRQYAISHRKNEIDLSYEGGYTITYNYVDNCLECGMTGNWLALGDIVFDTEETAQEAINEFSSDLVWYFTQAKQKF